MYTIGEVAHLLGISTHTLRYYEKEKIIIPDRTESGDRRYNDSHIRWLQFVIKLKETQMPISKIKQYASLFLEGEHTTIARLTLLEEHKRYIEQQIKMLIDVDDMLERKIVAYKDSISNRAAKAQVD
ncbi:MerR family transcriptional regulator [Brevibacillus antibioticus]|uniref:MerR family transcriptional regulator n=1 Tax=Brevibacillus antibioticus TaxID=2570228 RepID=A0A4U2Y9Y8_9BACL|nr:MerR family transcriptional regulator [Brevibacillus antibioticus]TKI56742.1 MerR family transcriptional regulator [Brevibacillus antibioticus]